ncbi:MAG TPA: hypothetical protein VG759_23670 [Candidatus Angelobacter sp.]|jgi:hypothetical protein|nr:hypothetical protein [Candidatus Angelobacter sp.]
MKHPHFATFTTRLMTILFAIALVAALNASATPIQIYGTWHCSNDGCGWGTVRDMTDFDAKNHWIIDRGDGVPSVNLVVLSFVNPLKLLNQTNDAQTVNGVPIGMNAQIVSYFTSKNIRVMLAIGGITFVTDWNTALATNPSQLGLNAAAIAKALGVGIEIDYEENTSPNLSGLQSFINAYRSQLPYDATGANPAARLTIDLGAGDRFLIPIAQMATSQWLTTSNPVLDYANALVPSKQPSVSSAESNWLEHVDGKPNFAPPIPPLAPAKFTGSLFITDSSRPIAECTNFSSSLQDATGSFVQTVAPAGAGTSSGMLGFMFWASECPSSRNVCTTPPNSCQGGVGTGAKTFGIPIPMLALRQQ